MQPKNDRHVRLWDQKDAASSIENKTPPTGAAKAADTPAAAPLEIKSRLSREFLNFCIAGNEQPRVLDLISPNPPPISAPEWMIGPSGPTAREDETEQITPNIFPQSVRMLKA